LRPDIAVYTRRVTFAWCCFFAAQLAVSLTLFFFASMVVWSFYVNVLDLPLVALMFAGEYLYRLTHVHNWPRSSVIQVIRAFAQRNAAPARDSGSLGQNRAGQNRADQNRTDQNRADQNRGGQNRAAQDPIGLTP
jgi:hypothetical protein